MGDVPHPWQATEDPNSGLTYYWNTITNETSWERPRAPADLGPPGGPDCSSSLSNRASRWGQGAPDGGDGGRAGAYGASDVFTPAELNSSAGSGDTGAWLAKNEVHLSPGCPPPFTTFEAANLPASLLAEVKRAGFPSPSPIQGASWGPAMRGQDVVGVAKTGSGKTLGFLMPAFLRIMRERKNPQNGPTTLVMAPTRELATQIQVECSKFGQSSGMTSVCLYGGAPKGQQLSEMRRGVYIIIVTPGRLNDFLEAGQVRLQQVSFVVMDEADRMLDMGFEPQIRKIMSRVPPGYQSLMYTATWPREVRRLASEFQRDPVQVTIGTADEKLTANKDVEQRVILISSPHERDQHLVSQINTLPGGSRVLIFCSTKRMCDQLQRALSRQIGCNAIHGDKEQRERERVLNEFKSGRAPIMVATDVAARGLDVKEVRMVINYEMPPKIEDYIHRIGRTGRAGAKGIACTFLTAQDMKHASALVSIMRDSGQKISPDLEQMARLGGSGGGGGKGRRDGGGKGG
eukprot:CAMPEP_0183339194 /NCGR_PEP_ID=MMETSP0164_2-20130417/6198_1 /TAXON_ID=221442 /ORGANISM="Coccolithus pelagicus ssp braarudi, Strain PLY182g" /LENGTH=516 /DNA_ID=CAMNT_0025509149 /DNA_START=20 /DNA_END=1567 /DNA_ORIENTATION=-